MNVVYAVASYDGYYPTGDNVRKVFSSKEDAEKYVNIIKKEDKREGYVRNFYEIFTYRVY